MGLLFSAAPKESASDKLRNTIIFLKEVNDMAQDDENFPALTNGRYMVVELEKFQVELDNHLSKNS